jgi:cardiolipin synthase
MLGDLAGAPWWLLALAAIGVLSISATMLNLFTAIGERPGSARTTDGAGVGSDDFLVGLSGLINAPLQKGGYARILNNGDEFVPAMLEAISGARRSINFMTYIWKPGKLSDQIFDALTERAAAGIQVRVMVDGLGGFRTRNTRIAELREAGGKWVWFNPPRFGKLTRIYRRNHRRAIVIDGEIGFTGGMAIDDKWLGSAQDPDHWRESMVEVRGCIAGNLQSAFTQLWSNVAGELLVGPDFFPTSYESDPGPDPGEPISWHISVISSPSGEAHPLRQVFWLSVQAARQTVYITNPYFVPDKVMSAALMERARAGVDVRVLVPNENIDLPIIRWASHGHYDRLLVAGVRIFEYQPTMIHSKLMVVDGRWSIVGSANLDVRSKELNQENVLGIRDAGLARELEQIFMRDLESAVEVDLERWRGRPMWHRLPERISLLFEEQF